MPSGHELHEQLSWHWEQQLRPRLVGLTPQEAAWEPVPGCWGVRAGVLDGAFPTPDPAPVTTIAWRLGHLGLALGQRASTHFGDRVVSEHVPDDLLPWLDAAYDAWSAGVLAAPPERFDRAHQGPPGSADQRYPLWAVQLALHREVIHHGAEACLLRDLYLRR